MPGSRHLGLSPICPSCLPLVVEFIKRDYQEHEKVEATVEEHHKQAHLDLFEESRACLHVDVDQSRASQSYEFILCGEQIQLALMIEFKVVRWGP